MIGIWFNEKIPTDNQNRQEWFLCEDGWVVETITGAVRLTNTQKDLQLVVADVGYAILHNPAHLQGVKAADVPKPPTKTRGRTT